MSSLEIEDNAVFPDCDSDGCITAAPEQEKRAKFYIEDEHDMVSFHVFRFSQEPAVQFSNLADFYVYLTLISLSKINLYHRFKLWSRSARFSDDLQI